MSAEPTLQVDLFAPSLVEATTRRLRDEILSGALEPGARLIEEQICQRFSISRAPCGNRFGCWSSRVWSSICRAAVPG